MKSFLFFLLVITSTMAEVVVDIEAFGKELGGWNAKRKKAADYSMSDSNYRTFKPVITDTPGGGKFISLRVDNRRGFLSSDDHALLQITLNGEGTLLSLESSIHVQGKNIKSDIVLTTGKEAAAILGDNPTLNAGLKLAKDLSAKLAGETKVEAGRVVYPAVIVHNYNKLMKCIQVVEVPKAEIIDDAEVRDDQESKEKK